MAAETIATRPGHQEGQTLASLIAARSARKLLLSVARRLDERKPGAHMMAMASIDSVDDLIAELDR